LKELMDTKADNFNYILPENLKKEEKKN
ncbi:hypothetical protein LCGC14_2246120, partial [marine sediment metagenome]